MANTQNKRKSKSVVKFFVSERGDLLRSAIAEFVGTAILVLFTCGTCVASGGRGDALVSTALSFGLTVACLAATLGHISGCHINPGVTVGLLANGQLKPLRAIVYFICQIVGGIAGAAILAAVLPKGNENVCATKLNGVNPAQGIVVEAFIVFLLVFVVINVCDANPNLAPLTIGLAISAGHLFAIPLTSSSMNTARSFGPAVIQGYWKDHYVYWIGPLVGGALAGVLHRYLFFPKSKLTSLNAEGEPTSLTTTM